MRCGCQSVFASSQDDITSELFHIGKTLLFTNNGWPGLVKVKSFSLDKTNVLRIIVTNINGDDIITTKEHLCSLNNPDVGWIPSSVPEYKQSSKTLSEKDIEKSRRPNICHRCSRSLRALITSLTIFHLQLCYGYLI